jgi:hypothetical protein
MSGDYQDETESPYGIKAPHRALVTGQVLVKCQGKCGELKPLGSFGFSPGTDHNNCKKTSWVCGVCRFGSLTPEQKAARADKAAESRWRKSNAPALRKKQAKIDKDRAKLARQQELLNKDIDAARVKEEAAKKRELERAAKATAPSLFPGNGGQPAAVQPDAPDLGKVGRKGGYGVLRRPTTTAGWEIMAVRLRQNLFTSADLLELAGNVEQLEKAFGAVPPKIPRGAGRPARVRE